jgi:hypothetical protein
MDKMNQQLDLSFQQFQDSNLENIIIEQSIENIQKD